MSFMSAISSAREALVNPVAFATDVVAHAVLPKEDADALSHSVRLTQAAFVTGAVEGITGMVGAGEWGRRNAESLMQGVTGIDQDNLSTADKAYADNVRFGGEIVGIAGTCLIPGSLAVRGVGLLSKGAAAAAVYFGAGATTAAAVGTAVAAGGAATATVAEQSNIARLATSVATVSARVGENLTTFNNAANGMGFWKRAGMELGVYDGIDQIAFQGIPELIRTGGDVGAATSKTLNNLSAVVLPKVLDVVGGIALDALVPAAHAATIPDQTRTNSVSVASTDSNGINAPNVRATFTEAGNAERSGAPAPRLEENIISRTIGRAWDYVFGQ